MFNRLNPHLLALVLPLTTFSYLSSAPHGIVAALAWPLPFWLLLAADFFKLRLTSKAHFEFSGFFYDTLLYVLVLLQLVNIGLMLLRVSQMPWQTDSDIINGLVNLVVIRFLVGTSSGTSGIVVAHELIHRPQRHMQWLGRLLLYTVGYDHFIITHTRGHHQSIGLSSDIAAAHLGESFTTYWRRVYRGHIHYAWQAEQKRLGLGPRQIRFKTVLQNRTLHGVAIEAGLVLTTVVYFGWLAGLMFIIQAHAAVRILEAVNYFQHWGLEDKRYAHTFGWVCDSPVSRYALIGLSHHIGHHENEHKPFYRIAYSERGPKMPYGYFAMNLWVKLNNASYRKAALGELQRYGTAE